VTRSTATPSTTDRRVFRIRLARLPSKRRSSRDPIALVSVPGNGKQPVDKLWGRGGVSMSRLGAGRVSHQNKKVRSYDSGVRTMAPGSGIPF
jgi:hypothetical protein